MAELERTRERERPPLQDNPYERTLKYRREQAERNAHGPIVIRKSARQAFMARQGRLRLFREQPFYQGVPLLHRRAFTHRSRPTPAPAPPLGVVGISPLA